MSPLLNQAIALSVISFLPTNDYVNFLMCNRASREFDVEYIWRRLAGARCNRMFKRYALINSALKKHGALALMREATSVRNLNILLVTFRRQLTPDDLKTVCNEYLVSGKPLGLMRVRLEASRSTTRRHKRRHCAQSAAQRAILGR